MFPTKIPRTCDSNVNVTHLQKRNVYTHHSFDEIPYRDLRSLNSQLASFVRTRNFLATWTLFCHMHGACLNLDAYTFTPVLGACSSLPGPERGKQVHGLMIKTGSDTGTVSKTALMDMYSKFGFLNESVKAFQEMEFKDVVTWNALLSSFLRHGLAKEAFGVFEAMRRERVEISEFTLSAVLKACASLKAFEQGKQVHSLVVVLGRDMVVLGTALIDFYSVVGCISDAMKVFYSFDGRVDDVMRNSLISGCVRNRKYEEAFSIISTMRLNVVALTSALAACSENSDLWIGKQIHCDDPAIGLLEWEGKLKRASSVPASRLFVFGSSTKLKAEVTFPVADNPKPKAKPAKEVVKTHPLFSLFDRRRKKKTTAKPEFARYLEYVKEGGMWDSNSNTPIIHHK
ncbi:hypothetical protein Pint_28323 [Pistacia integerrima]|uniref:Uncharacterized protein n=1 Tax=Pistacia integerrima TaxID=434235 RepID=A0ACC0YRP2_9ROSI|nr:hypothetical protein Pint_28323 [Pistacia integerrima]